MNNRILWLSTYVLRGFWPTSDEVYRLEIIGLDNKTIMICFVGPTHNIYETFTSVWSAYFWIREFSRKNMYDYYIEKGFDFLDLLGVPEHEVWLAYEKDDELIS